MDKRQSVRKWVLVTGASRGLGRYLSIEFGRQGYNIIINATNRNELKKTRLEILACGAECVISSGDLRGKRTIDKLVSLAEEYEVCLLVNNAAVSDSGLLKDMTRSQINKVIDTNLIAAIELTRRFYFYPAKSVPGAVIFINSLAGLVPQFKRSVYCASKWGLRGFARSLSIEAKNPRILSVYISRVKTRPEFTYGLDPAKVARKIYNSYRRGRSGEIIINGRPKKK